METEAMWIRLEDGSVVAEVLDRAAGQVDSLAGEVALDFSAVRRIDSAGLQALDNLVRTAEEKAVKVTLRGTNVGVYKVLKLMKLTPRVSFVN